MRRALLPTLAFVGIFAATLSPAFAVCTANKTCSVGSPPSVSCSGSSSCSVLSNGVNCDGIITFCSGCSVDYYCPSPPFSRPFILYCTGISSCSIDSTNHSITCDDASSNTYPFGRVTGNSITYVCEDCEAHPNECDQAPL
jgi:hypothetical protein